MGTWNSKDEAALRQQEAYVNKRMKDKDIGKLKGMHGNFWHPHSNKYNNYQVKGYLRQEYHGTRKHDSYVLDHDLRSAGVHTKRHR